MMIYDKNRHRIRILIIASHASLKFGGEAALPFMFFRLLRQRKIDAWLCVHERTRSELRERFEDCDFERIHFIEDTFLMQKCNQISKYLPKRLAHFTLGYIIRLITQIVQKKIAKDIIKTEKIDIIHQPFPVSPKEPSILFEMGVPVIIGPMNGGMQYPPEFRHKWSHLFTWLIPINQFLSDLANKVLPGKLKAEALVYANSRTKMALPQNVTGQLFELVENGIDFSVWDRESISHRERSRNRENEPVKFIYVGRLVDWKGVDILLEAFAKIIGSVSAELEIIGEGSQREQLEQKAKELNLTSDNPSTTSKVKFSGWLSQKDCAHHLSDSDVFVLSSLYECGGAVVLEAMAMGLPSIATKWGGPVDYINEECGILVEPSSREEFVRGFADAMLDLAQNPNKRKKMGEAGYQRAIEHFDWNVKIDKILEIYYNIAFPTSNPSISSLSNAENNKRIETLNA